MLQQKPPVKHQEDLMGKPSFTRCARMFFAAVPLVVISVVGVAGPASAGSYYTSYNPCPYDKPYQRCNAFGDCYCSQYP